MWYNHTSRVQTYDRGTCLSRRITSATASYSQSLTLRISERLYRLALGGHVL